MILNAKKWKQREAMLQRLEDWELVIRENEMNETRKACFTVFSDIINNCKDLNEVKKELVKWIKYARKNDKTR